MAKLAEQKESAVQEQILIRQKHKAELQEVRQEHLSRLEDHECTARRALQISETALQSAREEWAKVLSALKPKPCFRLFARRPSMKLYFMLEYRSQ